VRIRKELWFGFGLMALVVAAIVVLTPWGNLTNGHLGLIMLALIVVAIMLGFPTAFTLMGMGVAFAWLAYRSVNPDLAVRQVLDLMVQRTYGVMSNDVLIAVPLFVFMGYLVERAALIERLFKSLHLALARVPGSLAVATVVTCAIFATATGIVGAVVTLMGLLALPAMLRAGYDVRVSAGSITAGGCLGILIPPSVLLIVYGATAGVSVVQLYAGAFFPGLMLAGLYVLYLIALAVWKPKLMPPLPENERQVPLSPPVRLLAARGRHALVGLARALAGTPGVSGATLAKQWVITLLPALVLAGGLALIYRAATAPAVQIETAGVVEAGGAVAAEAAEQEDASSTGIGAPPVDEEEQAAQPAGKATEEAPAPADAAAAATAATDTAAAAITPAERLPAPTWFWVTLAVAAVSLVLLYALWTWERLELFRMLLTSFFPLSILIAAVLGSIVFGLATPTEAAAVGAFGGLILAAAYRYVERRRAARAAAGPGASALGATLRELGGIVKESTFLTAKTSAMVCWLFVGSAIFSAAFALLGGQEIVERWVLSLDLSPVQFMILSQVVIFLLGWPLEWTEIIVIFMPIFIPLLAHYNIDPLFFGLLVALNLQTAFLSPPVAMSAFYLKGVSPPHVTLNQIFAGMMPFMAIQVVAIFLLYMFPGIGLWLPSVLYGN
jgi:TRAP-type mannitol/chloroaromatic compound transport system permease large subunit